MSGRKKEAMLAFLKSDLFLRFAGGFALGVAAILAIDFGDHSSISTPAYAAPASTPTVVDRAAG